MVLLDRSIGSHRQLSTETGGIKFDRKDLQARSQNKHDLSKNQVFLRNI